MKSEVSRRLHGWQLPGAVKKYVWMDQLLKLSVKSLMEGNW